MSDAPFKPIESASENLLSLNVALLLAIAFLKSVGDFQALSVASCLDFAPGLVKVILPSRLDCVPKVPSSLFHPVVLKTSSPPPFETQEQDRLKKLCPVQAIYVHRSGQRCKSDQLFVNLGSTASKQTIS